MLELINKLAGILSSLESDDNDTVKLRNDEFEIDDKLFFVTGNIYYTSSYDKGDYFTPPSGERNFSSAELEVLFYDENDDEDIYLNDDELQYLYRNLD